MVSGASVRSIGSWWSAGGSGVQGLVDPPRVKGRGHEGKGQGKDFMTLNKPLTLLKGQGFCRGFYIKVL